MYPHLMLRVLFSVLLVIWLMGITTSESVRAAVHDARALQTETPTIREDFNRAIELYEQGEYKRARDGFRELVLQLRESPDREVAELMVAKCDLGQGDPDLAISELESFTNLYPTSSYLPSAYLLLGEANYRSRDLYQAGEALLAIGGATSSPRFLNLARLNLQPLVTRALTLQEARDLASTALTEENSVGDWVIYWTANRLERAGADREALALMQRLQRRNTDSELTTILSDRGRSLGLRDGSRLTIGVLAPFSDAYADYGTRFWRGILTAAAANGANIGENQRLRLDSADTGGDPRRAVLEARRLSNEGAVCVIGPLSPEALIPSAISLDCEQVPQVVPVASQTGLTALASRLFQMTPTPEAITRRLVRFAADRWQAKTWAVLAPDTESGHKSADAFVTEARRQGGRVYPPQFFEPGAIDYGQQLKRIRRYIIHEIYRNSVFLSPEGDNFDEEEMSVLLDCLFVPATAEDLNYILPAIRFYSFHTRTLGGDGFADITQLSRAADQLESATFASTIHIDYSRPSWQRFAERYRTMFGESPDWLGARGFDCLSTVLSACENIGGVPTARDLRTELTQSSFDGTLGRIEFGSDRINTGLPVYEYRDHVAERIDTLPPPIVVPDSVYVSDYLMLHPEMISPDENDHEQR